MTNLNSYSSVAFHFQVCVQNYYGPTGSTSGVGLSTWDIATFVIIFAGTLSSILVGMIIIARWRAQIRQRRFNEMGGHEVVERKEPPPLYSVIVSFDKTIHHESSHSLAYHEQVGSIEPTRPGIIGTARMSENETLLLVSLKSCFSADIC